MRCRWAVVLALPLLLVGCGPASSPPPIKNVLLVSIDTLRADHLGAYGYPRNTSPQLDALASSSWLFETAYAPIPRTGPSVAALLTGMFPADVDEWSIPAELDTLAELLSDHGLRAVAAVDNANLSEESGYAQGFEYYRETWEETDSEIERTHLITATARDYLLEFAETGDPFFMWLHYVNPHRPYTPPEGLDAVFIDDAHFDGSVELPHTSGYVGGIRRGVAVEGEHRLAYYVAQYDGEILFSDSAVGAVLDALRSAPELSDTLVVLTADHGEGLGEQDVYFKHGPQLLESHVRVPLIVQVPGETDAPRRITRPVSTIDVAPTVLALAGVPTPTFSGDRVAFPLAGESLVLTPDGELVDHRRDIFFASRNFWGIRSGELKMILKTRDDDNSLGAKEQLFDLDTDPTETRNVYDTEVELSTRLSRRLDARRQIQANHEPGGGDTADRFEGLTEEALENLRTLGYIR